MRLWLAFLMVGSVALAKNCPTDSVKPLLGNWEGVANLLKSDGEIQGKLESKNTIKLAKADTCNQYEVHIDYFVPNTENKVRTVAFTAKWDALHKRFVLHAEDKAVGVVKTIDGNTSLASFSAPSLTGGLSYCDELINFVKNEKTEIVRTIQCFDKKEGGESIGTRIIQEVKVEK